MQIDINNPIVVLPAINFENSQFKEQNKMNELFKLNIRRLLKNKLSKNFTMQNNIIAYVNI